MNTSILVVDDDPTNLKLAVQLLMFEGYEVWQANDAEIALTIIQEKSPGLVLLDLDLPGKDGLELTRMLRSDPKTRHICIVAITASAMQTDHDKASSAGCDGYFTKPFDSRQFPGQIAQLMAGRHI